MALANSPSSSSSASLFPPSAFSTTASRYDLSILLRILLISTSPSFGCSGTYMSTSRNMFCVFRYLRLAIHFKTPTVYVPFTITSKPSRGSMGGGCIMTLVRSAAFPPFHKGSYLKGSFGERSISRSIALIAFIIESALLTSAIARVLGSPVPLGSATEVKIPTEISSLDPNTQISLPSSGSIVKFSILLLSPLDSCAYTLSVSSKTTEYNNLGGPRLFLAIAATPSWPR
mmetsp:Transcript_39042/g.54966  ORF Transcript_39042/g.54966 Transcript_39042/m.54966 type:complete len:230 (+) Transcript_39042:340-1029(+)